MKKKKLSFKIILFINLLFLTLQFLAMKSFNFGLELPLLTLGTPLLCFVNGFFFVYWFLHFKWPTLIFFVAFALSFDSWQLLYQFKSQAINTSKGLNVMSFNVRSFNRYGWVANKQVPKSIEAFIQTISPDVVCFQEFTEDLSPQFKEYPYKVFKPYISKGHIGSCIISKYPLLNSKNISFDASSNGGMQSDLIWQRDTLRLYNIHFESLRINSKDTLFSSEYSKKFTSKLNRVFELQKNQMTQLKALFYSNRYPEIICTDLNNNAFSESYHSISKGRLDAFTEKGNGFGATYQFPYFPLRIDYIFTSKNIKVLDFKTHNIKLSDHKPISAVLQWP